MRYPLSLASHDSRSVLAVKGPALPLRADLRGDAVYEGKGENLYGEVVPNTRPVVESVYVE